jgi:probable HAF family extracellular repeat protein
MLLLDLRGESPRRVFYDNKFSRRCRPGKLQKQTLKLERLEARCLLSMYEAIDLGTLDGTQSSASAINDAAQVVGYSYTYRDRNFHSFLYDSGAMTDLGTLRGPNSEAWAINNKAQVVGIADTDPGENIPHAYLYENDHMSDLGTLGGRSSGATAINDQGQVVGYSYVSTGNFRAFVYDGSAMTDLGTLGGGNSEARGINNAGQIVGDSTPPSSHDYHAFLCQKYQMVDLGTLGGRTSSATAINISSQIVGYAETAKAENHAFLYQDKQMTDLGTLGGNESRAWAINSAGQIVGSAMTDKGINHAFLFDDAKMIDLNKQLLPQDGWILNEAKGINDNGQIVGAGLNPSGQLHAFLLNPSATPGPSGRGPSRPIPVEHFVTPALASLALSPMESSPAARRSEENGRKHAIARDSADSALHGEMLLRDYYLSLKSPHRPQALSRLANANYISNLTLVNMQIFDL